MPKDRNAEPNQCILMFNGCRKHAPAEQARVQRGMIRYVILVVDCSAAMMEVDFKPSRFAAAVELVRVSCVLF